MKIFLFSCCLSLLLLGCKTNKDAANTMEEMKEGDAISLFDEMENTTIAESYEGSYSGLIPCADCMGIQFELKLKEGGIFTTKKMYLGKSNEVFTSEGKYQFEEVDKIISCRIENKITAQYHLIGNTLVPIGKQNEMSNNFQNLYSLTKDNNQLTNRYWRATQLMKEKVELPQRDVFLIFRNDSSLNGSDGCNKFSSSFSFDNKEKSIQIKQGAKTKMACAEKNYDSVLGIVLAECKFYKFDKEGNLILLSKKKKALGTFIGSSFK